MPYLRETFNNRSADSSSRNVAAGSATEGPSVLDSVEVLGFRARTHPRAVTSVTVPDIIADPYAYFLEDNSTKKYQARLAERGLQPQGSPDRGHAFELKRHTIAGRLHSYNSTNGQQQVMTYNNVVISPYADNGDILHSVHRGSLIYPAPYQESDLGAYAQQAYNRVAPDTVVFDAANFLAELREGIPRMAPHLLKDGARVFKDGGSDYLGWEFGWKPFLRDIQNLGKALMKATELLTHQGQRVHRKTGSAPVSNILSSPFSYEGIVTVGCFPGFASSLAGPIIATSEAEGLGSVTKTATTMRWFEGEFTSFLPLSFDPNSYVDRFNALTNFKITPQTLWELAPWSWLIDWFLHIEDTIAANQKAANDLLIMHYGYAMETTVYTTEVEWSLQKFSWRAQFDGYPTRGRYLASTTYKRRLRANPYGFKAGGSGGLSGSQFAILGALGLTKTK
jgi:hypothetical protein